MIFWYSKLIVSSNVFVCLFKKIKLQHHNFKILAVIISLTAYLCSFPGLGNAGIVCFGDDGHVAITSTNTPSLPIQNTIVTDHSFESEEDDHCEDHCNSCIDFPLSFTTVNQNICQNKYVFKLIRNPLCQSDAELFHMATAIYTDYSSTLEKTVIIEDSIVALRTIVLLI